MVVIALWLFGALLGYDASTRRGFSPVAGVLGGLLLGPLAVLMYFVSGTSGQSKPADDRGPLDADVSAGRRNDADRVVRLPPLDADVRWRLRDNLVERIREERANARQGGAR